MLVELLRINQRTATIGTGTADGGTWRVPFHMLRHVLDIWASPAPCIGRRQESLEAVQSKRARRPPRGCRNPRSREHHESSRICLCVLRCLRNFVASLLSRPESFSANGSSLLGLVRLTHRASTSPARSYVLMVCETRRCVGLFLGWTAARAVPND